MKRLYFCILLCLLYANMGFSQVITIRDSISKEIDLAHYKLTIVGEDTLFEFVPTVQELLPPSDIKKQKMLGKYLFSPVLQTEL